MARRQKLRVLAAPPVARGTSTPAAQGLVLLGVSILTLLVYQPAWHGGILWDDAQHLTRPELTPASGLWRIWFEPGATQQYYPVLHTAFWTLHRLWGTDTTGYHLVNILLHATSAWLLWRILVRLAIPGAMLAAAIFALHPVHVESVAWITELKNVLSGVFYFAAAFVYLEATDRSPKGLRYGIALALFVLALLSKTVTATLPAALLVVFWWQRGTVRWREDVRPLVPFFALGLAAGAMTIWMERTFIGAQGDDFALSFLERCLLAGHVVWFYIWKLLWPVDLSFIYPRWTIDAADPLQWLYPVAFIGVLVAAWRYRHRARGPLASLLFFAGTLVPALGFFNVYPFRFSFVADHFQYLASVGVIVLFASTCTMLLQRIAVRRSEWVRWTAAGVVCGTAAVLTWQQAHIYADGQTLYRETIRRNPSAWLAHNNLASLLLEGEPSPQQIEEATRHLQRALELKPDYPHALFNLGTALERLERREEAAALYRKVLEIDPAQPRALERLAVVERDRATALLERALTFEKSGRLADAVRALEEAERLDPSRAVIAEMLGRVLHSAGRHEEAMQAYRRALARDASSFDAHNDLGVLLAQSGQLAEAIHHFEAAVRLRPHDDAARANLANARRARRE